MSAWKLPENWLDMSDDEQTAWSLEHYLCDEFLGFSFKVTMHPFYVQVNENGADIKAIQSAVQDWFDMADGTKIEWGEPVYTI